MPKLTKKFIEAQPMPESGQLILRDDELKGFGVRLTPGCKSWIVEGRINGHHKRITIGRVGSITSVQAREQAKKLIADITMGVDPVALKAEALKRMVTLRALLERFLAARKLKEETRRRYRSIIERHLEDWLDMPSRGITKDMVEQRHRALVGPTRCGTEGKSRAI